MTPRQGPGVFTCAPRGLAQWQGVPCGRALSWLQWDPTGGPVRWAFYYTGEGTLPVQEAPARQGPERQETTALPLVWALAAPPLSFTCSPRVSPGPPLPATL